MQQRSKITKWSAGVLAVAGVAGVSVGAWQAFAQGTPNAPVAPSAVADADLPPLPVEYVPMNVIKQDWARRAKLPKPVRDRAFMQPLLNGEKIPPHMETLPGAVPVPFEKAHTVVSARVQQNLGKATTSTKPSAKTPSKTASGTRIAQAPLPPAPPGGRRPATGARPAAGTRPAARQPLIPRPVTPYVVPARTPTPTIPRWVRYPLEFQMCGIGIGTRAVDKDQYNRIDRYGLFAMHGNPTAVVVPTGEGGVTVTQTPPEVAALFPQEADGGLPNWASAITVGLDNNHVQWLYNRDTYSMGFVVDRLGFVDAIVVAGTYSPIAKTQLEDPLHTVQLGDDLRKVLFRYGYPDTIETYTVTAVAGVGVPTGGGGAGTGAEGATGSGGGAPGGAQGGAPGGRPAEGGSGSGSGGESGAAAGGGVAGNAGFRTFELRYEQSYNVVFTIRDNRVVRIYIFGDPDFFNLQRRRALRTRY